MSKLKNVVLGQQKLCHHGETGCSADATGYQQALSDGVSATRACVSSQSCLSVLLVIVCLCVIIIAATYPMRDGD